MRQSIGVIGGKPNHALYFIGCVGNDVIFLDPHTTQNIGFVERKEMDHERKIDASYHLSQASRSHILRMDPSIAVVSFIIHYKLYFRIFLKFVFVLFFRDFSAKLKMILILSVMI